MSRSVLVIAQYFPPAGGVGTFRVTKFVKYLPSWGWKPIVLSVKPECYPGYIRWDDSLTDDVPSSIEVIRTAYKHRRWLLDDGVRWFPALLPEALELAGRLKPAVTFLSGGPFFPLLAGPILRLRLGIPYVIDLRDPWRLAEHRSSRGEARGRIANLAAETLEPIVLRRASAILCVSEPMRNRYAAAYEDLASRRFHVVPNGYDPDDFSTLDPWSYDRFTIVFAGKFQYREATRDPTPFFRALRRVASTYPEIQFVHIGAPEEMVLSAARQEGVDPWCRFVGPKPYAETLRRIKGADLALLIGGGLLTEQSAKIFDYLGCRRPTLALAPQGGGIADVLRRTEAGWLIQPEDVGAIAKRIEQVIRGEVEVDWDDDKLARYSRPGLTRELAEILQAAAE